MNLFFILGIDPDTGDVIVLRQRPIFGLEAADEYVRSVDVRLNPFVVKTVGRGE
jgi:hypothetical protein